MYGVPADLPLQRFVGQELNQVCLGRFRMQLHFDAGSISVEGGWELRDPAGTVIDQHQEHAERDCYRVHQVIGEAVGRYVIDAPRSVTLFFVSGHALTVLDDSEQYESFSIHLGGEADLYV